MKPKEVEITCPKCHPILNNMKDLEFTYNDFKMLQTGGIITSYKSLRSFYHQNKYTLNNGMWKQQLATRPRLIDFF